MFPHEWMNKLLWEEIKVPDQSLKLEATTYIQSKTV